MKTKAVSKSTKKPARTAAKSRKAKTTVAPTMKERQETLRRLHELYRTAKKEWDQLSPEEQKEEEQGWLRAMRRMNEDRKGYRQVFVEDK